MTKYRVRFAAVGPAPTGLPVVNQYQDKAEKKDKSRYGCKECRKSRVKCDETFPVCRRCARRGTVCHAAARESRWQINVSCLVLSQRTRAAYLPLAESRMTTRDEILLKHWFEIVSRMMVTSPHEENPLSYPIAQYLSCQSLVHVIMSISAAHQHFFNFQQLGDCLEERSKALQALRRELSLGQPLHSSFLIVYMLGISSSYIDRNVVDFGKEHLFAAQTIIELIITDGSLRNDPMTHFIMGTFIYWDMSCAFLVDTLEQRPINIPSIYSYIIQTMPTRSHPVTGYSTEIFYLLSSLGRYLRGIAEGFDHDPELELTFEQELLNWEASNRDMQWKLTADAYRRHGLIMLYRLCGWCTMYPASLIPNRAQDTDALLRAHSLEILANLAEIPLDSLLLNIQSIPLLTAGGELTKEDKPLREQVRSRFNAIYSSSRIPGHMSAQHLLVDVWERKDKGNDVTWLDVMLQYQWRLRVG